MRLVHTSDVHLDMCFAASGLPPDVGNRCRASLRNAFEDVLHYAASWPADAVLIAGDLFEHGRVRPATVDFLLAAFERIQPLPVFIAPGRHDPCTGDSPYRTESWPENVTIFRTPEWVACALADTALTVHGFGFDAPPPPADPFDRLDVPEDGRIHVGVAYVPKDDASGVPFRIEALAEAGLRYLALGSAHEGAAGDGVGPVLWRPRRPRFSRNRRAQLPGRRGRRARSSGTVYTKLPDRVS